MAPKNVPSDVEDLPVEMIIPHHIVLTEASFQQVVELLGQPGEPTRAMCQLMAGEPVEGDPF